MFETTRKVMFKDCDPAGIVFYPRYFEMVNDCVETFFADALRWPFETIHGSGGGVPTAALDADFDAPSRHGDLLTFELRVVRLGRTSLGYRLLARDGDERRFHLEATLVNVDATGRPAPWPDAVRATLHTLREDPPMSPER